MTLGLPLFQDVLILLVASDGTIWPKMDFLSIKRNNGLFRALVEPILGRPVEETWHVRSPAQKKPKGDVVPGFPLSIPPLRQF